MDLRIALPCLLMALSSISNAQLISQKKGIAYGHHDEQDVALMSQHFAWWYNWGTTPETDQNTTWESPEYVPMMWSQYSSGSKMRDYLDDHPEVKYILGWNEPNFGEQANMTPAQAAANWHLVESIADDYDLKIVGPAVNYSPGNVDIPGTDDDADPWLYLDAFFEECSDCRVDFIAVHCYMGGADDVKWFISEFERYGKPIWVTEWAAWESWNPQNYNDQMNYLASTTRWMEDNPMIYRYSWYIGRQFSKWNYPYIDIYDVDPGTFTPLGWLYAAIPATDYHYPVPGSIEAEGFHAQDGFEFEECEDIGGGVNIGWAEPGDNISYKIDVANAGTYQLNLRHANGGGNSQFRINLDNNEVATGIINGTGDWQNWADQFIEINLPAGEHTLNMEIVSGGFNLNKLAIDFVDGVSEQLNKLDFSAMQMNHQLIVQADNVDLLTVYDVTGRIVHQQNQANPVSTLHWPTGVYLVQIQANGHSAQQRVLVE